MSISTHESMVTVAVSVAVVKRRSMSIPTVVATITAVSDRRVSRVSVAVRISTVNGPMVQLWWNVASRHIGMAVAMSIRTVYDHRGGILVCSSRLVGLYLGAEAVLIGDVLDDAHSAIHVVDAVRTGLIAVRIAGLLAKVLGADGIHDVIAEGVVSVVLRTWDEDEGGWRCLLFLRKRKESCCVLRKALTSCFRNWLEWPP